MAQLTNLVTVETSSSRRKAAEWLRRKRYHTLFLDFHKECEKAFNAISAGAVAEIEIEKLREKGIYKVPEDVQHYRSSKALFDLLPLLGSTGVKVCCYVNQLRHAVAVEMAAEILVLTIHARIGRLEPERWKQLVEEWIKDIIQYSKTEADIIAKESLDYNIGLSIPDDTAALLEEKGFKLEHIELDRSIKPIDILTNRIRREVLFGERISLEEVVSLVKQHVEFTDLLMKMNFDQAYSEWQKVNHGHGKDSR